MSDLRDLYQEVILDHNKQPRNYRVLDPASHHARGHNPLCGDQVTIYVNVVDDVIKDIAFQGRGCAISTASASLMTEILKGRTVAEAEQLFGQFHDLVTGDEAAAAAAAGGADVGKLRVLSGVREYPSRVKCATLAWHALQAALHQQTDPVVTE